MKIKDLKARLARFDKERDDVVVKYVRDDDWNVRPLELNRISLGNEDFEELFTAPLEGEVKSSPENNDAIQYLKAEILKHQRQLTEQHIHMSGLDADVEDIKAERLVFAESVLSQVDEISKKAKEDDALHLEIEAGIAKQIGNLYSATTKDFKIVMERLCDVDAGQRILLTKIKEVEDRLNSFPSIACADGEWKSI